MGGWAVGDGPIYAGDARSGPNGPKTWVTFVGTIS